MTGGLSWLTAGLTGVALATPAQLLVTRTSARLVMAVEMALTGDGVLWATRAPVQGTFLANLAGPSFLTRAVTWMFILVSIGALGRVLGNAGG
ncbi:hypothetical protein ACIQPR_18895 [Streptomyces sp. NPDC091280]|uniref:hypothetical protein n=1 Tax=Streptomyces sp. NPDC091280 TaxID=3365984 RepID=UPI00382EB258